MVIWDSHSIRAVWFTSGTVDVPVDELFRSFFGFEPEAVQRNRTPSPQNPFFAVASGPFQELICEIQWQPGRFEIILSENESIPQEDYPSFKTEKGLEILTRGIERTFTILPDAFRLAVVTNLVLPVPDYETGRKELADLTSFNPDIGDTSDFMLQLNKRKLISEKLEVNRVLRWSVNALQNVQVTVNAPFGGLPLPPSVVGTKFAASVLLDINTVPTFAKPIVGDEQLRILTEMVKETSRLASHRSVNSLAG